MAVPAPILSDATGEAIVLYADTPLIHEATLRARFQPLVTLIFTEDCAAHPRRQAAK